MINDERGSDVVVTFFSYMQHILEKSNDFSLIRHIRALIVDYYITGRGGEGKEGQRPQEQHPPLLTGCASSSSTIVTVFLVCLDDVPPLLKSSDGDASNIPTRWKDMKKKTLLTCMSNRPVFLS